MTSPNSRPAIDHSILSPSGHCSKRARDAALKRAHDMLFPPGYWDKSEPTQAEKNRAKAEALRRTAATLRDLAALGMKPRAYARRAAEFEADADRLDAAEEA